MNPRTAMIIAVIALVVGAAGLVFGISAKNGNKSDEDIANSVKTELEQQLGTNASQEQSQAAQQQTAAIAQARKTKGLNDDVAALEALAQKLQTSVDALTANDNNQANQIKTLQDDVNKLDTRVSNLGGK
jgi:chromosome condensin MukBEF ATPase and DNA-binding subunit MukB